LITSTSGAAGGGVGFSSAGGATSGAQPTISKLTIATTATKNTTNFFPISFYLLKIPYDISLYIVYLFSHNTTSLQMNN
jgi:hypothetical protein